MPGEIDTGGPRVLHHNSDWPISIYQKCNNLIKYNTQNYIINHKIYNHNIISRKKQKKHKFKCKKLILLFKTYYNNYNKNKNENIYSQYISKYTSKKVDELDISNNHLELDYRDDTNHTHCDFYLQFRFIQSKLLFQKNQNRSNCLANDLQKNTSNNTLILSDIKNKNNINNNNINNNNNKASRPNNYAWLVSQSDKSSKCKLNCENIIRNEKKKKNFFLNNNNKNYSYIYLLLLFIIILFGNTKTINKTNIKIISIGTLLNIVNGAPADYDAAIRAERSANLSHITGPSKKIQIFIKNRFLQIFPDGTVNGSSDPSNYTIIQRTSVSIGQLKIQGVATCLYLCMDACGLVYGSREYTDECVFNEMLEQSRYNTYSSVRWSTPRKTYYLGLNRNGQPRKVQYRGNNWDKLAEYARVLPITVPKERIVAIEKISTCPKHNIRHHHNKSHGHHQNHNQSSPIILPNDKDDKDKFKCKKNDKRKKRKRRCKIDDKPKFDCNISIKNHENKIKTDDKIELQSKRSCQDAASDEFCRQQILDASTKKRKSRKDTDNNNKKKNNNNNNNNHKNKKLKNKAKLNDQDLSINNNNNNKSIDNISLLSSSFNNSFNKNNNKLIDNISPLSSSFNNDNNNKSLIEKKNIKIDEQYSALLEDSTIDSITVKTETTDSTLSSSSSSSKLLNPSLDISLTIDSSVEVSDEDSNSHEEDTIITNDYGIPMTTMDTTPPERTEDYTKATTQSILQFLNINKQLNDDTIIKKLNDPIGQFAM